MTARSIIARAFGSFWCDMARIRLAPAKRVRKSPALDRAGIMLGKMASLLRGNVNLFTRHATRARDCQQMDRSQCVNVLKMLWGEIAGSIQVSSMAVCTGWLLLPSKLPTPAKALAAKWLFLPFVSGSIERARLRFFARLRSTCDRPVAHGGLDNIGYGAFALTRDPVKLRRRS